MNRPCSPPFRPSPGHEDLQRHSSTAGCHFYVVGVGYIPGIYTNDVIARDQVNRFSDGKWKKVSTLDAARLVWGEMCKLYHSHDTASPPPSPSPSPPASPAAPPVCAVPSSLPPRTPAPRTPAPRTPAPRTPSRVTTSRPAASGVPMARSPPPVRPSPSMGGGSRAVTHPAPSPAAPGKGSSQLTRSQSTIPIAESTRHPVPWRPGETLWGIQGTLLLFEDRYDAVDHIYIHRLSPAHLMESRDRQRLEAFVQMLPGEEGD